MAKLWQKDYSLNSLIEEFTVGNDPVLDLELIAADCVASTAHAKMLASIGILTQEEAAGLCGELGQIIKEASGKKFMIAFSDEDCHTAIEGRLTERLGDAGKKIHTGRSRNDQVATALRLYSKAYVLEMIHVLCEFTETALALARREEKTPMPGRTHLQTAMPSSVGLWAASFAEEIIDHIRHFFSLYELVDQCPLGSAASYGVPLPLNREMTASLMGFSRVQNNVLYANNSRGKFESMLVDAADAVCLCFSKAAQDLILFSLPEFGYFSLPRELCSGSSIMPQKKNPDGLELMRSKSAVIGGCSMTIKNILRSTPSGYNRDFQDTKEPFLKAARLSVQCVRIMELTFRKLEVNRDRLRQSFTPDIFATDAALEKVMSGESFRNAYKDVGLHLNRLKQYDPDKAIADRTYTGTTGCLNLGKAEQELRMLTEKESNETDRYQSALETLTGLSVRIF